MHKDNWTVDMWITYVLTTDIRCLFGRHSDKQYQQNDLKGIRHTRCARCHQSLSQVRNLDDDRALTPSRHRFSGPY